MECNNSLHFSDFIDLKEKCTLLPSETTFTSRLTLYRTMVITNMLSLARGALILDILEKIKECQTFFF